MDTNSRSFDKKQGVYVAVMCLSTGCLLVMGVEEGTNSIVGGIGQHLDRVIKINNSYEGQVNSMCFQK